jgi:hypothetical protein
VLLQQVDHRGGILIDGRRVDGVELGHRPTLISLCIAHGAPLSTDPFDLLSECGVHVEPLPDGLAHIGVPYTLDPLPGTPNAAELFAMALRGRF